jgi:hypothetical protein
MIEFKENGFIYKDNYYLYDKIVKVCGIDNTNKLYKHWYSEKPCNYEISSCFRVFLNSNISVDIYKIKEYKIKESIKINFCNNPVKYVLIKLSKKQKEKYLKDLYKYEIYKKEYKDFINNSEKTLDKFYKEVYNIRQELINILETKEQSFKLKKYSWE